MWLRNRRDVYRLYEDGLNNIKDEEERVNRLVELNVQEQVMKLAKTSIIQRAWKYDQRPTLHGWVYGLKDGIIKSLFDMPPGSEMIDIYKYDDL
jgi:carbonic anhydrase